MCAACRSGFERDADISPVSTKTACKIITCANSKTCGCPANKKVTGFVGNLSCDACGAGYSRKADVTVAVSAPSACTPNRCTPTTVPGSVMYSAAKLEGSTGDKIQVQCKDGMKPATSTVRYSCFID